MRVPFGKSKPRLHLSEVISALSYALDITEGQPKGHAARSCMIGMRLAREINLPVKQRSALFYALLLKDLGCSSTAPKVCYLFGSDDHAAKKNLKTVEWTRLLDGAQYAFRQVMPGASLLTRIWRFLQIAPKAQENARELVQLRCDRGATIARNLDLPEEAASAIRSLDEHWDGGGYPDGLKGDQIPLLARILGLSQTVEVFWQEQGLDGACDVAEERKKSWFDPELVSAFLSIRKDEAFWNEVSADDPASRVGAFEPLDRPLPADDATLDRLAEGFGQVIDAKSPWTHCHSAGVAEVAVGIGEVLGFPKPRLRNLRRAALLHDIGKLGISNLILDKPARLSPEELAQMRRHPLYTHQILSRVNGFQPFTELAASHHERLDGKGYHRGLPGMRLSQEMRALVVADMYEALAAKRPYRQDLGKEQVMDILTKDAGIGICPDAVAALQAFLARSHFVPYQVAA